MLNHTLLTANKEKLYKLLTELASKASFVCLFVLCVSVGVFFCFVFQFFQLFDTKMVHLPYLLFPPRRLFSCQAFHTPN